MTRTTRDPPDKLAGPMAAGACLQLLAWGSVEAEPMIGEAVQHDSQSLSLPVPNGAPEQAVSYDDLDLASAEDVKRLIGRIKVAASDVCRRQGIEVLRRVRQQRECQDVAFTRGMNQVNALLREHRRAARQD